MFPNSTTLYFEGNWNNKPGDKRMNKATATITGPQSAPIFSSILHSSSLFTSHSLLLLPLCCNCLCVKITQVWTMWGFFNK
uniref:Uncharacterized protein n=1 Tax=Glycine max TaxID=3847 RepID=C6T2S2_SOYBN|nr:unknown [Glycine max]